MQQPNTLSPEMLGRIRSLALEQVALLDQLQLALQAGDTPRVVELARQIVALEQQVREQ